MSGASNGGEVPATPSIHYFSKAWRCDRCGAMESYFDRSLCACGMMHHYCDGCGIQADPCWLDDVEPDQFVVDTARLWRNAMIVWSVSSALAGFIAGVLLGVFV